MGEGIASLMADRVNANRIDDFIERGEKMPGYTETEHALAEVRDRFPEVQYVYVYKIDGRTAAMSCSTRCPTAKPGSDPGEVVAFDQAFEPYVH